MFSTRVFLVAALGIGIAFGQAGGAAKQPTNQSGAAKGGNAQGAQRIIPSTPVNAAAVVPKLRGVELRADVHSPFTFVALGDLRETDVANHTSSDPDFRKAIIDEISMTDPKFVLVSGDLVLQGDNFADWKQWDTETAEWKKKGIKVFPAIGNHELYADANTGLENYWKRFPALQRARYYSVKSDNVFVIALDSSLPLVSGQQFDWMKEQLSKVPQTVGFVVFLMHHPPVTHSMETPAGGHAARQTEVVFARYLESLQAKSVAKFVVIAGHVHNYERYSQGGVTYIVSGGGGATPYMIPRKAGDAFMGTGPTYHFLKIDVTAERLRIGMEQAALYNAKGRFTERDTVTVESAAPRRVKPLGNVLPPD